ncbi:MAG: response regulator [Polyangiaceae bacterium]|nr:response regulator [Polyangiaceae bacterium]
MSRPHLLVVDDKPSMLALVAKLLAPLGQVTTTGTVASALRLMEVAPPAVVVCDLRLADGDGLEVLRAQRQLAPDAAFLLMTAFATVETAVQAMREGARDYLTKPFEPAELRAKVQEALRAAPPAPPPRLEASERPLSEALDVAREEASRAYLASVLRRFGGNVPAAAAHAGVERESFYRLLRKHGLRAGSYRAP